MPSHDIYPSSREDPLEARRDALIELGIKNPVEAGRIVGDEDPDKTICKQPRARIRHTSRRGGRSLPEKSGRDIGLEMDNRATSPEPADTEHAYLDDKTVIPEGMGRIAAMRTSKLLGANAVHHAAQGLPSVHRQAIEVAYADRQTPITTDLV